jgi:hypothetical protein
MANLWIRRNSITQYKIIEVPGGITAKQVMDRYQPNYLINGGLYARDVMRNITYTKPYGRDFSGYLFSDLMMILGLQDNPTALDVSHKDSVRNNPLIINAISGAPYLIHKGEPVLDWGNRFSDDIAGPSPDNLTVKAFRSIIGFNSGFFKMCATDEPITLKKALEVALSLDLDEALALDGGGSCHLQKDNTAYITSYRANVTWILVYTDNAHTDIPDPTLQPPIFVAPNDIITEFVVDCPHCHKPFQITVTKND